MDSSTLSIDRSALTPIVRRVLEDDTAEVVDWQDQSLRGGLGTAVRKGGVQRIAGRARLRGETVSWSVILKRDGPGRDPSTDNPTSFVYWQRELLAYQSGLFADLPGGIRAPAFYGGGLHGDRRTWLWLEDLSDEAGADWSDEQYARAARHLGQLNGAYLGARRLPSYPWLCRGYIQQRIDSYVRPAVPEFAAIRAHPDVRRLLPSDLPERLAALWAEHERWLAALETLPRTFCHLDFIRRNLFARRAPSGDWRTVAIDWSMAGLAGVGQDLATLVAIGPFFGEFGLGRAHELDGIVSESYLAGLRDAGWPGDARLARFGYAGAASLWYGLVLFPWAQQAASPGSLDREDIERRSEFARFLLDLADEARGLLPVVEAAPA